MVRIGQNLYNSYMPSQQNGTPKPVAQNKDAPAIGEALLQNNPQKQIGHNLYSYDTNSANTDGISNNDVQVNNQTGDIQTPETSDNGVVDNNTQLDEVNLSTGQDIKSADESISFDKTNLSEDKQPPEPNFNNETKILSKTVGNMYDQKSSGFLQTTTQKAELVSQQMVESGEQTIKDVAYKVSDDSSSRDTYISTYQKTTGFMQESQTIGYNSKEVYQTPEFLKTTAQKAQQITQKGMETVKNGVSKLADTTPDSLKAGAKSISKNAEALYNSAENSLNNISNNIANNSSVKWVNNKAVNIRNSIQEINPLVETRHINGPNGEVILNTAKSKGARTLSMAMRSGGAKAIGRTLGGIGLAYGVYEGTKETYKAFKNEGKSAGMVEGAKQTGGLVGAAVGAKIGVAIGAPIVPPVGAVVGGVVGGAVGYVVGSGVGKKVGEGVVATAKGAVKVGKAIVNTQIEVTKKVVNKTVEVAKEITPEPVKKVAKNAVKVAKDLTPEPVKNVAKATVNAVRTVGSWFGF